MIHFYSFWLLLHWVLFITQLSSLLLVLFTVIVCFVTVVVNLVFVVCVSNLSKSIITLCYTTLHKILKKHKSIFFSVQFSCVRLCDPMDWSMPGLPVHDQLPEFTQTHVHTESVMSSKQLILCHLLFLPPSIFPSIRIFSNESALRIRWPKYWSFSFNITPSNENSGLISFRMDWLDLLAVQGTLKSCSNTTVQKHQLFGAQLSL